VGLLSPLGQQGRVRSLAEFCFVLDTLLAVIIVIAATRS
jgi:hypothetical protein